MHLLVRLPRLLLLIAVLACAGGTGNAFAQKAADAGTGGATTAYTVTDMRGRQVRLERVPQRIVSLLPSLTESLCALDACERIVGVDEFSNQIGRASCRERV